MCIFHDPLSLCSEKKTYLINQNLDILTKVFLGNVFLEKLDSIILLPGRFILTQVLGESKFTPGGFDRVEDRSERRDRLMS